MHAFVLGVTCSTSLSSVRAPSRRRGHMGGMAGGALAALLLGPRWKVVRLPGKRGNWLVDDAPLPWFRSQPRPAS